MKKSGFIFFVTLISLLFETEAVFSMGGVVPSGYPNTFMMGIVDDTFTDSANSYGLGAGTVVTTLSQWESPVGGGAWDVSYRYLTAGLACTGSGWYNQFPGNGGTVTNFANAVNAAGYQPVFIYYQMGIPGVQAGNLWDPVFMGEYFQDWSQLMILLNTWMSAHPGKIMTVDVEPDVAGYVQQSGFTPTSQTVEVASAQVPSCATPWKSLAAFPNTFAGYSQALLYLKDQYVNGANNANLHIAFHVSGWAVNGNPAANSGFPESAAFLATHASTVASFVNACQPAAGSRFDLFFTDPSGYDGGYDPAGFAVPSPYSWDAAGGMATQYAHWLNDLTGDVNLRAMLWQVPMGNSKMNNTNGHFTDTRPEYLLNDSALNSEGYAHNVCQYLADGVIGVLWGRGDLQDTGVMDYYVVNPSPLTEDGTANGGAGSWMVGAPVVDDDGGFFRTHASNAHLWAASCGNTSTPTSTATNTATNTVTKTATNTFTNTPTSTVTSTFTVTLTFTSTSSRTNTMTASNTATKVFTNTFTNTMTSTSSLTSTNTASSSSTNTLTSTHTLTGTTTFTPTLTETSSPTNTSTLVSTNTLTAINTATKTSTLLFTSTPTPTHTLTGTTTFTPTLTETSSPTNTSTLVSTNTLTAINTATKTSTLSLTSTPTPTHTLTLSTATEAFTSTLTMTQTATFTPLATNTLAIVWTGTLTNTPVFTPTLTPTSTPFVYNTTATPMPSSRDFFISKNVFTTDSPVSISVSINEFPGIYDLTIFNSAGELIKNLDHQQLTAVFSKSYQWDGKNKYGDKCATGIYVIYLTEPNSRKIGRIVLIRTSQ